MEPDSPLAVSPAAGSPETNRAFGPVYPIPGPPSDTPGEAPLWAFPPLDPPPDPAAGGGSVAPGDPAAGGGSVAPGDPAAGGGSVAPGDPAAGGAGGGPPGGSGPNLYGSGAFGDNEPPAQSYFPPASAQVPPQGPKQGWKTWVAGATAAMVLGIAGFIAIQAIGHHSTSSTATNGAANLQGPPGQGQGGPAGGFPRGFGGRGTFGTIRSISGSTITLTTPDGSTTTVTTSSLTTVTNSISGSIADIKSGDHVVVMSQATSVSSTAADRITDRGSSTTTAGPDDQGAPTGQGGFRGPGSVVSGTVSSVANGTLTISEAGGSTARVSTSSSTTVTLVQPSSVPALKVGDNIRVTGTTTSGTVAATSIQSGDAGFGPGGGPGAGFGPGGPNS